MTKDSPGVAGKAVLPGDARGIGDAEVLVHGDSTVVLRQSCESGTTALEFTPSEWTAFVAGAKAGEFDEPW